MTVGAIAIERLQAGLEATRGTAVAATRRVYPERGGWFDGTIVREFPDESRSSYIKNYAGATVEVGGKLSYPAYLTAADFAWYGQGFFKGGVTGVLSNTAAYAYAFAPTAASDDLKTATFEAYSDAQGYQLPFCLGEKLEVSWQAGKLAMLSVDYTAQQAIPQAVTASIADRTGLNPLTGTTVKVFADAAGGTIGTTPLANVLSGKITWANNWDPITHTIGNLFYDDAARLPRFLSLELDVHFNSPTEYAFLKSGGERLIQVVFTGPNIASSSPATNESVTVDFYGYYLTGAFAVTKAIRTVKLTADSQYDTVAATDWNVSVVNALATLP